MAAAGGEAISGDAAAFASHLHAEREHYTKLIIAAGSNQVEGRTATKRLKPKFKTMAAALDYNKCRKLQAFT